MEIETVPYKKGQEILVNLWQNFKNNSEHKKFLISIMKTLLKF